MFRPREVIFRLALESLKGIYELFLLENIFYFLYNVFIIPVFLFNISRMLNVKYEAVPSQTWTGPEGSRKLRFPHFVTTAQDGGKVVSLTHRPPLPPGNTPGTHFC